MSGPSWFQRFLLPGFAFNAFVIGGGYATGRELVEFFMPSGPRGGLLGMALATVIWCVVCVATFLFARRTGSGDYRTFFRQLLGPGWVVFEVSYLVIIVLILAVFCAAVGAMGAALFGWPTIAGSLALMAGIGGVTALGTGSVERLFKYATIFLYGVYALFVAVTFARFGDRIAAGFAASSGVEGWAMAGFTYASYNVLGAVVILPVLRHLRSDRDAVAAGLAAGPIAMIPALFFFACIVGWYPAIGAETLPSEFMLRQLGLPLLYGAFQLMIFLAILETGVGAVHAFNERIAHFLAERRGRGLAPRSRLAFALLLLGVSVFVADRFGLVTLIARGYRALAWLIFAIFVLPLMTWGLWRLAAGRAARQAA
ncbi:MAG TPA: hypothetical protein VFR29_04775 [Steroidobacteraceae bacterium]|nr:hypothetical protein [Steroidobacteraceae bacterium]